MHLRVICLANHASVASDGRERSNLLVQRGDCFVTASTTSGENARYPLTSSRFPSEARDKGYFVDDSCAFMVSSARQKPANGWLTVLNQENHISATEFRVNEGIRVNEVRLIGADGNNVGVVPIKQAIQMARDAGMDLVEVSPTANPPVCRVIDYGKFVYERAKKEREAKRAQTRIEVKEIRLRPKTNEAHRGFKVDDARRWLLQGNKVRVTIKFRGREMDYPEIALEDLKEIAATLADVSIVEQAPMMEGRTMLVVLAPVKPGGSKKKEKGDRPEVQAEASAE
jgi:translation initiation factor IF-3